MVQFNYHWLSEWFSGVPTFSPEQVTECLSLNGFESEIQPMSLSDNVVVGYVLSCEKHPQADKLNVCMVDVGEKLPLTIVCGCPSVKQGIKVCCALVGAKVGPITIAQRALRGVTSQGMLCSMQELGFNAKHNGIWHLHANAPVGERLSTWLRTSVDLLVTDVTPNRGDAMSVRGLSREIALAMSFEHAQPWSDTFDVSSLPDALPLSIESDGCDAFHVVKLEGINSVATPDYIACRLVESGITLHNVLVDIVNYVMLETGQPMHTYDADKLSQDLSVGYADEGTTLALLNGDEVVLDGETLVVKSEGQPVCIAGYMGGSGTQVEFSTSAIYLEAAVFDSVSVAKSCRKYPYHTHSGARFERGIDSQYTQNALNRAVSLIVKVTGAEAVGYSSKVVRNHVSSEIVVSHAYFKKMLGYVPDEAESVTVLQQAGFAVSFDADSWKVTPPSWRNEVTLACHVLSECIRLLRLLDTPSVDNHHLVLGKRIATYSSLRSYNERMSDQLIHNGWYETLSSSFMDAKEVSHFLAEGNSPIALTNPLMQSMAMLRPSLWVGILHQLRENIKTQCHNVKLFEFGKCFFRDSTGSLRQPTVLAMCMVGAVTTESWYNQPRRCDFYAIKSSVNALLSLYVHDLVWKVENVSGLHPHQCGAYYSGDTLIATVGVIHPSLAKHYAVADDTSMAAIFIDDLLAHKGLAKKITSSSVYPLMRRDLSLLVPDSIDFDAIAKKVALCVTKYLKDYVLFDIYSGSQVSSGFKGYSLGFVFQHNERSLVEGDVQPMLDELVVNLDAIGVLVRGESNGGDFN